MFTFDFKDGTIIMVGEPKCWLTFDMYL